MNILFVTSEKYPAMAAGAIRLHTFARLCREAGHNVYVIGNGQSTGFGEREFEGVPYVSLRAAGNSFFARLRTLLFFTTYVRRAMKRLPWRFDCVFLEGDMYFTGRYFRKLAAGTPLKLVWDRTEWYSREEFRSGRLSPFYIINNLINRHLLGKGFSAIAISSYLEREFSGRGIPTLRIPIIFFPGAIGGDKLLATDKVVFSYAGSPGGKDMLKAMLEGFAMLSADELRRTEIRIIGPSRSSLTDALGVSAACLDKLEGALRVTGRLPHGEVVELLRTTDFTMLLRPPRMRYAMAGLPSKVIESLFGATPVISNLSSDLGEFLTDGGNSIIVPDASAEAFASALGRALRLSHTERLELCRNARQTAEELFDAEKYADKLHSFMA